MEKLSIPMPMSRVVHSVAEALDVAEQIDYPLIIRPSFTLGGEGGGVANHQEELIQIATNGLSASPTQEILVEQSILGWKEFEMEVMRDHSDNCVIICSIENFDPMGVHTGIVSQWLLHRLLQMLSTSNSVTCLFRSCVRLEWILVAQMSSLQSTQRWPGYGH